MEANALGLIFSVPLFSQMSKEMKETAYGYSKVVAMGYDEAIEFITEEIKKEGFGVLTTIDVTETFRKKLGVEFKPYTILGACNPHFAYESLQAEEEIGLMLPCNIIVYVNDAKETVISAINPMASMQAVQNPALAGFAVEVQGKIKSIMENIP